MGNEQSDLSADRRKQSILPAGWKKHSSSLLGLEQYISPSGEKYYVEKCKVDNGWTELDKMILDHIMYMKAMSRAFLLSEIFAVNLEFGVQVKYHHGYCETSIDGGQNWEKRVYEKDEILEEEIVDINS